MLRSSLHCQVKKPGDILFLHGGVVGVEPGFYVLLSSGENCCLCAAREDERGMLTATNALIDVTPMELRNFRRTGMAIEGLRIKSVRPADAYSTL